MGLLDFVKSGVKEMMIARPENDGNLVFKWPDRTIPMFAQVTVRADEWAVFAREGRPMGTLDAGRHTLQAASIPFLSNLMDQYTGGNMLLSELYFVKRTPFPMRFGGSLGNMIDPMTQIRVRGRCHGELLLSVNNPERMIFGYFGTGKYQENPDVFTWLTDAFFMTVKNTIGTMAKQQRRSILDIMDMTADLSRGFVQSASDLNEVGVSVVRVSKFEVDVPEEDLKRFDEMRQKVADQLVGLQVDEIGIQRAAMQAQAEAARAQVGVQTAALQAQANQFALDQKFSQDARYSQMAGSYQSYAAGQALVGAGQGMAQGGGMGGPAAAGVQLGVGLGVAQMYQQGIAGAAGTPFSGVVAGVSSLPPGAPPPPPPPGGVAPVVAAVFHVQFPDGTIGQAQGHEGLRAELTRRGLDPAAVNVWTNGMGAWAPAAGVLAAAPPPTK